MYKLDDYVRWRGDLGWDSFPITTEDLLFMSALSYIPWEEMSGEDYRGKTLAEVNPWVFRDRNRKYNISWLDTLLRLWNDLPKYKRFASVRIEDFESEEIESEDLQFAAATFTIGTEKPITLVVFRGTGKGLVGWRENVNMVIHGYFRSQDKAKKYLEKVLSDHDNVYVAGHSKGGTLSMYSAACAAEKSKIVRVCNFDGPGLDHDTYIEKWDGIADRTFTVIPNESLFGISFGYGGAYKGNCRVVQSDAKGLVAHDNFTWLFDGPRMHYVNDVKPRNRRTGEAFHRFMESSDEQSRAVLVNTVIAMARQTEGKSFDDIISRIPKKVPGVIKTLRNLDRGDKKIIMELLRQFAKEYIHARG